MFQIGDLVKIKMACENKAIITKITPDGYRIKYYKTGNDSIHDWRENELELVKPEKKITLAEFLGD